MGTARRIAGWRKEIVGGAVAAAVGLTVAASVVATSMAATTPPRPPAAAVPSPSPAGSHEPAAARLEASVGYGAVGEAIRPGGAGYWAAYSNGMVVAASPARWAGDLSHIRLSQAVVGVTPTPDGGGYWMVAADGGIFGFGDAHYYGSTGNVRLNRPIVGMASTPDGRGYWLVATDGGIFNFGDARFYGSTGNVRLNQQVEGMAASGDGHGYLLVAADGGVFTFGDAPFHGSAANVLPPLGAKAVGITATGSGGYWVQTTGGQVLAIDAPAIAAPANLPPAGPRLPAGQNPASSIPPSSQFNAACWGWSASVSSCNAAALQAINSARSGEGYGPLALPSGFYGMSTAAQLVATADAERTARGLPAMGENPSLDSLARSGAQRSADPTGPSGYTWASNLAIGYPTALAADFAWMYDDGVNSPNVDCKTASSSGCWGHRRNILSPWGGAAGAGVYNGGSGLVLTQLFAAGYP